MQKGWKQLTSEEKRVIEEGVTEAPFTGQYDNFWKEGVYVCRRCETPLFRSQDKFDAGCGWPSFDKEFEGSVTRLADKDGRRTEIRCTNCGAHLGHVFEGEELTPNNTRHCVNSISLRFVEHD